MTIVEDTTLLLERRRNQGGPSGASIKVRFTCSASRGVRRFGRLWLVRPSRVVQQGVQGHIREFARLLPIPIPS